MAIKVALLLLFFFQIGALTVAQQEPAIAKASIEGIVLRSGTDEPLARAELRLTRVPAEDDADGGFVSFDSENQGLPVVSTESDGKFLLKDLEPGEYWLTASRNGFAQQMYGRKFANGAGKIITLIAGEALKNIVFRMIAAGTVTGRVRDVTGEPVPGLVVSLMRIDYFQNSKAMWPVKTSTTDDRGEYRLFWIEPGRHYLRVGRPDYFNPGEMITDPSILPTYYPGTLDIARAVTIDIQPGGELSAIDVLLPKSSAHWIRGRVVDASTGKPPKSVNLSLRPKQRPAVADWGSQAGTATEYNPSTGVFGIRNVIPGTYWLTASMSPGMNAPLSTERLAEVRTASDVLSAAFSGAAAAQLPIDMPASDVNDVVLTLTSGVSIPVRLRIEGPELSSLSEKPRVSLSPVAEGVGRQSTPVNDQGAARIENVLPGNYTAQVNLTRSMNLYAKEILYGRDNALDEPMQITDGQPNVLSVLLSDRGGQIEGILTDALAQPVSGVQVVLIPDLREKTRLFKTVNTDRGGRFVFRAIPPGGYKVFAWEALKSSAYHHDEILSKYETQGRPVRIQEASKITEDLRIIPESR